jgi:CRP/FNR family transcriptional regulator, dissimilatory nitrate respiration regulator
MPLLSRPNQDESGEARGEGVQSGGGPPAPKSVLDSGRLLRQSEGTLIFSQGDPAARFYLVLEGEVSIRKLGSSGEEVEVSKVGPGQWFAEVIAFADARYPAQATALRDCALLEYDKDRVDSLLRTNPEAARFFLGLLARKCLTLNERIEFLTLLPARSRIARYFLGLCPRAACPGGPCSFDLPRKKREIAAELGMAPETLSRGLKSLEEEGLLVVEASRVTVPRCPALRAVADEG